MTVHPASAVAAGRVPVTSARAPSQGFGVDDRVPSDRARGRTHVQSILAFADALAVGAAAAAVAWGAPWLGGQPAGHERLQFAALSWVVTFGLFAARGTYAAARRPIAPRVADELGPLVAGLLLAGVTLVALRTVGPLAASLPAGEIAAALGAAALSIPLFRELAMLFAARSPANVSRVVVVGSGFIASYLTNRLARSRLVDVLGIVDDRPLRGHPILGPFESLPRLCAAERVDRVVIAFSERHPARTAEILQELRGAVDIDVVVRYFELASWESRLSDVTGLSLLSIGPPAGVLQSAGKRALDIAIALVSLLVLSPVLAAVALAVRVESKGPALFRQVRVGRGRRPFHIVKFRTMRPQDEPLASMTEQHRSPNGHRHTGGHLERQDTGTTPFETVPDPARITRVGGFLRRTGLDELPQLFNVLRGEMSLVGPRPFIPEECATLRGAVERRFDVRPGMTGMWQVCGQHEVTLDELSRLDVQYATSWSLRGDLRILARTPGRLARGSAPGR